MSKPGQKWTNWAGNVRCRPARRLAPRDESQLLDCLRQAREAGRPLRVAGSGHSFAPLVETDGLLVDLSAYAAVVSVDPVQHTVTVQAGTPLWRVNDELHRRGLALENMGTLAAQTAAGAVSTGTHGTGLGHRSLSSQLVGLRIITTDGLVLECSPTLRPEVFSAARIGLGALGVISTMTFRCVPAFSLHLVERPGSLRAAVEEITSPDHPAGHRGFFWSTRSERVRIRTMSRTAEPPRPRGRWTAWRDDHLSGAVGQRALSWLARRNTQLVPVAEKFLVGRPDRDYVEASHRVLTFPQPVPFVAMEYALPLETLGAALEELRLVCAGTDEVLTLPIEVRVGAGEDIPLSPAYGRPTGYVNLATDRRSAHREILRRAENVLVSFGGRPHWGKLHSRTAAELAGDYPRWEEFQRIRRVLDPPGVLLNEYLREVLGP